MTARLGDLEKEVMDILWDCRAEVCTRDVLARTSRELAYTTVATVLNNLVRKGLVERVPAGRTWAYRPVLSRGEYTAAMMTQALSASTDHHESLLHFVGTMSEADVRLLRGLLAAGPAQAGEDGDGAS